MANLNNISRLSSLASLAQKTKKLGPEEPTDKRFRLLQIDEIVSHEQVRKKFDDLDDLAASIKELGVQVPINVTDRDPLGHYVIIQGERRWRAAKMAGLTKIPAIVVQTEIDDSKRMLMQLTENLQRDDMLPIDIAKAFEELTEIGLTASQIAKSLGRSHQYVSTYLQLNDLPPFLHVLASDGNIKDATTLVLLKRACEARPDVAQKVIYDALDENRSISRSAAQKLLKSLKAPKETPSEEGEKKAAPETASQTPAAPAQETKPHDGEKSVEVPVSVETGSEEKAEQGKKESVRSEEEDTASVPSERKTETSERPAHEVPVMVSKNAENIRLVPMKSLRITVEVMYERDGDVIVENGWLSNNALSMEEGRVCVVFERNGKLETEPVPCAYTHIMGSVFVEE